MLGYSLLTSRRSRGEAHFKDAKRRSLVRSILHRRYSPQYFPQEMLHYNRGVEWAAFNNILGKGSGWMDKGMEFLRRKNESFAVDPRHM